MFSGTSVSASILILALILVLRSTSLLQYPRIVPTFSQFSTVPDKISFCSVFREEVSLPFTHEALPSPLHLFVGKIVNPQPLLDI